MGLPYLRLWKALEGNWSLSQYVLFAEPTECNTSGKEPEETALFLGY